MLTLLLFALIVACILAAIATEASAGGMVQIRSSSGRTATVAASAAASFRCLIGKLEAAGYRIDFMGGWRRHGSVPRSKHPAGLAIDINQTARNRVTRAFPKGTNAMAASCGLKHGAVWRDADGGHFEVVGRRGGS